MRIRISISYIYIKDGIFFYTPKISNITLFYTTRVVGINYIGKEIYFKIPIDVENKIVSQCAQFFKLIKHI